MNKFIIALAILIVPLSSLAHYALSSKYYLEASEEISMLNIYLSQSGVERAMVASYGIDEINSLSTTAYKELLVNYIRDRFHVKADGREVELLEGGIKLGSHQTDLKFILTPVSANVREVDVFIPAFMENEEHQTIFSYNLFGNTDKVILSAKNDFRASIVIGEEESSAAYVWLIAGLTLVLLLTAFIWKQFARPDEPSLSMG